jgi:hypothetical protein
MQNLRSQQNPERLLRSRHSDPAATEAFTEQLVAVPFRVGRRCAGGDGRGGRRGSCRIWPTWRGREEARSEESAGHGRPIGSTAPGVVGRRRPLVPRPAASFDRGEVWGRDRIARPGRRGAGDREWGHDVRAACRVTCESGFRGVNCQAVGFSRPT